MMISTSGRSRRASAAKSSISWRGRALAVNSTTPWLMIVRCQPSFGFHLTPLRRVHLPCRNRGDFVNPGRALGGGLIAAQAASGVKAA